MSRPAKKPKSRFSRRLIRLREGCGLTQYQFADAIKVDRWTVCYWECVARNPRQSTLEKLADFFHVTPGYFLDDLPSDTDPTKPDLRTLFASIRRLKPEQQKLVNDFVRVLRR